MFELPLIDVSRAFDVPNYRRYREQQSKHTDQEKNVAASRMMNIQ